MNVLAISYHAPPALTPQAIQIGRQLYHLDARVCLLHGRDTGYSDEFDQYPDFFNRLDGIAVPDPGARLAPLAQRALRRAWPWYGNVPDALGPWRRRALPVALAAVAAYRPDALLSFGMPMSDHLLALAVRRRTGLPWLAHFSDPWADNPFHLYGWPVRQVNRLLERQVLGMADQVLFTSQATLELVMARCPAAWRTRAAVLPHAWDRDHFAPGLASFPGRIARAIPGASMRADQGFHAAAAETGKGANAGMVAGMLPDIATAAVPHSSAGSFAPRIHRVRHLGACYGARSPEPLFAALERLARRASSALERVVFEFVGHLSPALVPPGRLDALPPGLVALHAPVGYRASLDLADTASALLLIDAPSRRDSVFLPSKLIDYIGAARPVWGITPPGAAADLIAQWSGPAATAPPDDPGAVAAMLEQGLAALDVASAVEQASTGPPEVRERYAAPAVAAALGRFIEAAITRAAAGGAR